MTWPEDALTSDEEIVTMFRPHWKLLAVPFGWFILLTFVWALVIRWFNFGVWGFLVYLALGIWLVGKAFVRWWTTRYVLTSERLITRNGLISKSGIEIPLENITNVNFSQTIVERSIGAGDLLVESAGESGQSAFRDIPHPDKFQTLLYRTREARTIALSGRGEAPPSGDTPQRGGVANAEAIQALAELRDQGHISEAEFESKRSQLLEEM